MVKSGPSANNRPANTKERDASIGLDNHGFRYYDADSGRYVTRDPIGYGDGLNVYAHVHNDPVNGFDPLGLVEPGGRGTGRLKPFVRRRRNTRGGRAGAGGISCRGPDRDHYGGFVHVAPRGGVVLGVAAAWRAAHAR